MNNLADCIFRDDARDPNREQLLMVKKLVGATNRDLARLAHVTQKRVEGWLYGADDRPPDFRVRLVLLELGLAEPMGREAVKGRRRRRK